MNKEINSKYNKGLEDIMKLSNELRKIEYSDESIVNKHKKASELINKLCIILIEKKNYLLYRPFFHELHDRMAYYYNFMNKVNLTKEIPLFRFTLHNEAVKWWLKSSDVGKFEGPLIHFDTHDDMEVPKKKRRYC